MSEERPGWPLREVRNAPSPVATMQLTRSELTAMQLTRPELAAGQIWIARPDDGEDLLVLVTEVHDDHVQALLCSHDDQFATESDVVLDPPATGYPARLLIHGDLAARIMKSRLQGSPGRVHRALVRRIVLRGHGFDFHSRDLGRGAPLLSDADPRWRWKEERLRELRSVQARAADLGWKIHKFGAPRDGSDT
jgi:hypothetical protein